MAGTASNRAEEAARIKARETNQTKSKGRGADPEVRATFPSKGQKSNPSMSGGINRATKPTKQHGI